MHHVSRFRETLESHLFKLQMPLAGGMLTGREHWIRLSPTRVDFTCRTQDAGTRGRGSTTTDIACTILRLVLIYRLRSIGIVLSPISLLWGRKPPRVHSPPSLVLILVASPHQAFQVPPSSYRKIRHWVSATYL
jgi:hypothetical protein